MKEEVFEKKSNEKLVFCARCKEEIVHEDRRDDIRKLIRGWKILNGIELQDKSWDRVHYSRMAKSAKSLLILFRTVGEALDCMEFVFEHMRKAKLTCTIETIVKRSDLYREQISRQQAAPRQAGN